MKALDRIKLIKKASKDKLSLWVSYYWQYYYTYRNLAISKFIKHKIIFLLILLTAVFLFNFLIYSQLERLIKTAIEHKGVIEHVQNLFLALGGALIGASAIAFSLIMFAMQVNVERMPYGLFQKFSSDSRLLLFFVLVFSISISIACFSLISSHNLMTITIMLAFWLTCFVIILFLFAYRRALTLINPVEQLNMLRVDTQKTLKIWSKAAKRASPILKKAISRDESLAILKDTHDIEKTAYFNRNPQWTNKTLQAIGYCNSVARFHARQGDYEVSEAAIYAIVVINADYISEKGKTFYKANAFFDDKRANDPVINTTLEYLRQMAQIAISNEDEQSITLALRGFYRLSALYLSIDYSTLEPEKWHAKLASGYLSSAVELLLPHKMADVLMEGVRSLGTLGIEFVYKSDPNDVPTISSKISTVSIGCVLDEKLRPVTMTGMACLADLMFSLINSNTSRSDHPFTRIANDIKLIALFTLEIPDGPLLDIHSNTLGAYYSVTSPDSFLIKLTYITNALLKIDSGSQDGEVIMRHISQWSNEIYESQKDLFLYALKKESDFVFHLLHWHSKVIEIILALSNANCCTDYLKLEFEKNSRRLISILGLFPDNESSIGLLENKKITDLLFELAVKINNLGYFDISSDVENILLRWLKAAVKYPVGLTIFVEGCYALTCLYVSQNLDYKYLIKEINNLLSADQSLSIDDKDRAIERIKSKLATLGRNDFSLSQIELAMDKLNPEQVGPLLEEVIKAIESNN